MRMIEARDWRRPRIEPIRRFLLPLLVAQALAGCHRDSTPEPATMTPTQTTTVPVTVPPASSAPSVGHGYFAGTVSMAEYGEALLTVDGAVRIHVEDTSVGYYVQFIGHLDGDIDQGIGSGVVTGEACAGVDDFGFCGERVPAKIRLTVSTDNQLSGEVQVTTADGVEAWSLEMVWPTDTYLERASLDFVEGQYSEGRMIINVNSMGYLFFQNADSGCVGNGVLTPHLDGEFNVYDVTLTIANCENASLNAEFEGMATRSVGEPSGWGDWLLMWLSTPEGAPSPGAMTMWGRRL
jgi:hypothetical protein